jgi:tetratricopeptide (TPR) repeat protein
MKGKVTLKRLLAVGSCLASFVVGIAAITQTFAWGGQSGPSAAPSPPQLPSPRGSPALGNRAPTSPLSQAETANLPNSAKTRPITLEEHADIFLARKAYSDAADYYLRALRQGGPKEAYLWNKLGIAYQLSMNYSAARKAYKQAAHYNSEFAEPWNNLGTTYFLQNKFGKSAKYYRRAIKLRPQVASFHMNLSAAYSRMKKFNEAVEECREALRIDPNVLLEHSAGAATVQARGSDVEFYYYLAKVFASISKPDEAVRYLRRALEDGFKDIKRLDQDPDFQKISTYPAYVELRKKPPVAIAD